METAFTRLVGCRIPIQQAGMGAAAGIDLAVAVADAGALGMLGLAGAGPEVVAASLDAASARTNGTLGANFLVPFLDRDAITEAASRARVVELFYGDPEPGLVDLIHQGGALAAWQVGSVAEARMAVDAGCDLVVAQGVEAGGHVRGELGLLVLLDLVLDAVDIPVLAAGGVASARTLAAVLAAGAAGARVGTRFLAADEADVHTAYLGALVAATSEDTVLTTTFSALWPDAPHRVLRACVDAVLADPRESVGEVEMPGGHRVPLPRLAVIPPSRTATGNVAAMPHYAGQSVGRVRRTLPAADIVAELADGAEQLIGHLPRDP